MGYGNYNSGSNIATEFNSSIISLIRLNKLIEDANEYSRLSYLNGYNLEYLKLWRNTLMIINREVSVKMTKKERTFMLEQFKKTKNIGRVMMIVNTPEGKTSRLNSQKFQQHWALYDSIDRRLRLIADARGMLITNKPVHDDIIGELD